MNKIVVETNYSPHGTIGRINILGKLSCYTVERPWLNNEPGLSCVPAGVYDLEWHEPTDVTLPHGYKGTWAMVNHDLGVSHYPHADTIRTYCHFGHIANFPYQVKGCVGFGDEHIIYRNMLKVSNSSVTTAKVLDFIKRKGIKQVEFIRHGVPEYKYEPPA